MTEQSTILDAHETSFRSANLAEPCPDPVTLQFLAERRPGEAATKALADLSPKNPFNAPAYAAARAAAGAEPWLLAVCRGDELITGCYGFLHRGHLASRIELPSLPELPHPAPFWAGLVALCRDQKIAELKLISFGSTGTAIPALGRELERRARREFHLDLTTPASQQAVSSNHKRNIKRAKKAGLAVLQTRAPEAAEAHARAIAKSMRRREVRGEQVSTTADPKPFRAFIDRGAGQLFQATAAGRVVSSLLVLRAAKGAYYHSAGSFPEGMAMGAAHFLIHSVAERLRDEGLDLFNLGGADATEAGLARFKAGFGARPLDLEAARFDLAPPLRRGLIAARRLLRA